MPANPKRRLFTADNPSVSRDGLSDEITEPFIRSLHPVGEPVKGIQFNVGVPEDFGQLSRVGGLSGTTASNNDDSLVERG